MKHLQTLKTQKSGSGDLDIMKEDSVEDYNYETELDQVNPKRETFGVTLTNMMPDTMRNTHFVSPQPQRVKF
jgi:hypothetical protein